MTMRTLYTYVLLFISSTTSGWGMFTPSTKEAPPTAESEVRPSSSLRQYVPRLDHPGRFAKEVFPFRDSPYTHAEVTDRLLPCLHPTLDAKYRKALDLMFHQ